MLIAQDELGVKPGIGSVRSVPGFDVHAALSECSEYLLGFGGHPAAAGLKIEPSQVESFREAFCEYAAKNLRPEQRTAELWIDAETTLGCLNLTTVQQIERLAPFGYGKCAAAFDCFEHRTCGTAAQDWQRSSSLLSLEAVWRNDAGASPLAVGNGTTNWSTQWPTEDRFPSDHQSFSGPT